MVSAGEAVGDDSSARLSWYFQEIIAKTGKLFLEFSNWLLSLS